MNDFKLCIDKYFDIMTDLFNLLVSNWLLALILILFIASIVVSLVNTTRKSD